LLNRLVYILLFLLFPILNYSQEINNIDSTQSINHFSFNSYFGSVIPHEKPLNPLKKGLIKAFEVNYSFKNINSEPWNKHYNNPEIGVSYLFIDLGYSKVLGYAHCFYPYISFPLAKYNKPISLNLKTALGLSYASKVYDSISNPLNVAISSHINLYASLGLEVGFKLSNKLNASIGIFGSHLSNGAIKKPNYGLNILTGSFGISYNLSRKTIINNKSTNNGFDNSRWFLIAGGGIKEANKPGGSKYGVGSLSLEYSMPYKTFFRFGSSLDYMYDASTIKHFRDDLEKYNSKLKASKVGVTIMSEMALNRLSAFANLGIYLYNHDKQNDALYQRIGLRYRFCKSLYSQIALKTHMNVADYIEFAIVFKL